MHRTFCSFVVLCVICVIETRQQFGIQQAGDCHRNYISDKSCSADYKYNEINCRCEKIDSNNNNHMNSNNAQSANGAEISKVITDNNQLPPKTYCQTDQRWNGSACILEAIICPGGYQWNENACIMRTSVQIAALIPSPPDLKCKHAQELSRLADEQKLPPTTMPIYSTSPSCPFSFVLSDNNECVKQLPTCPYSYVYRNEGCYLRATPIHYSEDNPQLTKPVEKYPNRINVPLNTDDTDGDWLQTPSAPRFRPNLGRTPPTTIIPIQPIQPIHPSADRKQVIEQSRRHDVDGTTTVEEIHKREQCCSIISPRICRQTAKRKNAQWQCYNHKYNRCGNVCTKPKIQLRPRKSSFAEPLLVMPPPPRRLLKITSARSFSETNIGAVFDFDMIDPEFVSYLNRLFVFRLFRVFVWGLCLFECMFRL